MKIRLSRATWNLMGYRAGWKKTVLDKILAQNQSLIKISAVSPSDVEQAISANINMVSYNKSFILRENDERMEPDAAKPKLVNAFMAIYRNDSSFSSQVDAYVSNKRPFSLGAYISVESGTKYLVPTFNNIGLTSLKSVFTTSLGASVDLPPNPINFSIGDQKMKPIATLLDLVKMVNKAGFIVKNSVVEIGTIGSRSTNWDTSYNLKISGSSVPNLLGALTNFTSIENVDVRNQTTNTEYNLTMAKEVGNLMSRLGLRSVLEKAVKVIKKFEFDHNLKDIYNRYNKIPNYKTNTKIETISLAQYEKDVFAFLVSKIMTDFSSLFVEGNVSDPQEVMAIAYSMGFDGDLISDKQAQDLIEAAA